VGLKLCSILASFCLCFLYVFVSHAADWSEGYENPPGGRPNPHQLSSSDFKSRVFEGKIHAQRYPVSTTGVLLPEEPIKRILNNNDGNPIKLIFNQIFKAFVGVDDFNDLFRWLGLLEYPDEVNGLEQFVLPYPDGEKPDYLLGYSQIIENETKLLTMSCATCHSGQLFGQTVLGMSKRFPRANEFFIRGVSASKLYNRFIFKSYSKATDFEMFHLERSLNNLEAVGLKSPLTLGLDTSLAQVALSLNKREDTEWAEKSSYYERWPRPDVLDHQPGDSKPAVWWNLKYKDRWLSDGSVISGNPIVTNLLWNEVGRGSDLKEFYDWLQDNSRIIEELTSAVFSIEAPRLEDFFDSSRIPKESALKGEVLFNKTCTKCHGSHIKNWSLEEFKNSNWSTQIKTHRVDYPKKAKVKDVGTDPYRYMSMKSLEQLNKLRISKDFNVVIQAQEGYVPPPLVGIWARWPYFHNNSVPSLCAIFTPQDKRPKRYYSGSPLDKERHFDFECNGYPTEAPREWRTSEHLYDTRREGMANTGHDFVKDGEEMFTQEQKRNLIHFLQTL